MLDGCKSYFGYYCSFEQDILENMLEEKFQNKTDEQQYFEI